MRYIALATDFDGTLAHDGRVPVEAIEALKDLRKSGRATILVTGRLLESLEREFATLDLFDIIIAENGALLYEPATRAERPLATPPPERYAAELQQRGVAPLEIGRVIVSTWEPHEREVLDVIRDQHLELEIIFNKGAVMTLPSGVNKASGLSAALEQLGFSARNVVGIGDAENDQAFLRLCGCGVAVANALDSVKETADIVLASDHGYGVAEIARQIMEDDLQSAQDKLQRRTVEFGTLDGDGALRIDPFAAGTLLVAGSSRSGKSTVALALLEHVLDCEYQLCVIDPEGDYEGLQTAIMLGDAEHPPTLDEIESALKSPSQNIVVNLLGIPIDDRQRFFSELFPRLVALRSRTGRPHWIFLDEAHHLFPSAAADAGTIPRDIYGLIAITTGAAVLSHPLIETVTTVIAVGEDGVDTLHAIPQAARAHAQQPNDETVLVWNSTSPDVARLARVPLPQAKLKRHRRKYAKGDLAPEKSFFFRGPQGKLNLRADNLVRFIELARGVDDETWLYHLKRGEYARWFDETIGDDELAQIARRQQDRSASESRDAITREIERRYTAPA